MTAKDRKELIASGERWLRCQDPESMVEELYGQEGFQRTPAYTGPAKRYHARKTRLCMIALCRANWDALDDIDLIPCPFCDGSGRRHIGGGVHDDCGICEHGWFNRVTFAIEVAEWFADGQRNKRDLTQARDLALEAWSHAEQVNAATNNLIGVGRYAAHFDALYGLRRVIRPGLTGIEPSLLCEILRDLYGNPHQLKLWEGKAPFRVSETALNIARAAYDSRNFDSLPILADALEDAGCTETSVLEHCRGNHRHWRGCWVVDLVVGKN